MKTQVSDMMGREGIKWFDVCSKTKQMSLIVRHKARLFLSQDKKDNKTQ